MSDGYPLGADCDLDAIRNQLAAPNPFLAAEFRFRLDQWGFTYLEPNPVSSPRRGDRAADSPGDGGAPNPKEHP